MTAITKIGTVVKQLAKLEKSSFRDKEKLLNKLYKTITDGSGKPSPIVYEGKYLDELPDLFKQFIQGAKKPKVIICAKSSQKGQGILGVTVKDGNKTTSRLVIGVDSTKGELPIIQVRGVHGTADSKALTFNTIYNPNIKLDNHTMSILTSKSKGGQLLSSKYLDETNQPALLIDTSFDKNTASKLGYSKRATKQINSHQSLTAKKINQWQLKLKQLFETKGNRIYSINDCLDDVIKIAQRTEKPTFDGVSEVKNILAKKMGYDPAKIDLKFGKDGAMAFNQFTGQLTINPVFLSDATYQDIAVCMAHELTHMEDFVKLYKKIGPEKFEQLVRPAVFVKENTSKLNHKWYQEMSKFVDADSWKFNEGLAKTIVTDNNGKIIKKINHLAFNANTMIKELKNEISMAKANFSGKFAWIKDAEKYQFSEIEEHARLVEKNILYKLENQGLLQTTKYSATYGEKPSTALGRYDSNFKPLEEAIEKLGGDKSKTFNDMYYKELELKNKRLAELSKKMDSDGLPTAEVEEMQQLIKTTFGDVETMETKIISNIAQKLGVSIKLC